MVSVYYHPSMGDYCSVCCGVPTKEDNAYYKDYIEYSRVFCGPVCEKKYFNEHPSKLFKPFVIFVTEKDTYTYYFIMWSLSAECAEEMTKWFFPWVDNVSVEELD